MQILELTFNFELNESLQIGDHLLYASTGSSGDFSVSSLSGVVRLGEVTDITRGSVSKVKVLWDNNNVTAPSSSDFIMFVKNRIVNTSGLVGYYADVEFKNNSTKKVELFAVSSEVEESSK